MPELTLRDGMVIVGSLLILAVMVDAWRRMRLQRSRVRMKLAEAPPESGGPDDDISMFRELPNGGARVVSRSDYAGPDEDLEPQGVAGLARSAPAASRPAVTEEPGPVASAASSTTASKQGTVDAAKAVTRSEDEPAPEVALDDSDDSSVSEALDELVDDVAAAAADDPVPEPVPETEQESVLAGVSADDGEPANLDWLVDLPPSQEDPAADGAELPHDVSTEVIMLHVMARDERGFSGKSILEILLACDLRFGDMSFFHRHEQEAGRGPIQFSVANMLQPGVFDIDNMDQLRTRGLVFFLTLPGPEDMFQAFEYMLETARAVARNLNGELLDESRSVLTQQCVEHSRQQIREFERRLLAQPSA